MIDIYIYIFNSVKLIYDMTDTNKPLIIYDFVQVCGPPYHVNK